MLRERLSSAGLLRTMLLEKLAEFDILHSTMFLPRFWPKDVYLEESNQRTLTLIIGLLQFWL